MKVPSKIIVAVHRLYALIDQLADQLVRMDNYWNKCFPCTNKGCCCVGVDIPVYEAEWLLIAEYLSKLCHEDIEQVKKNLSDNILCPFHLTTKCAIHTVRPLYCRFTPYMAVYYEAATEIEVMYPAANCTFIRQHCTRITGSPPQSFESLGGRHFIVITETVYKAQEFKLLKDFGDTKYLSELLSL
jgi:Fe-S-cluster containining protein